MRCASAPGGETDPVATAAVEEQLLALDAEFVGLAAVKQDVRDLVHGLLREDASGTGEVGPVHCAFSGAAGVGKASVALRLARLLHAVGRLRAPRVHRVTRDDLVAPFAGYTATKTVHAIREAAGGVLLVDKAYELTRPGEDDHGREALDLVVRAMSAPEADLMVVIAGEGIRLEQLLAATPQLRSLISHELAFPEYDHDELLQIVDLVLGKDGFRLDESGYAAFSSWLRGAARRPGFANVRTVRRALDRARLRQARRIALYGAAHPQDMVTISAEDVVE